MPGSFSKLFRHVRPCMGCAVLLLLIHVDARAQDVPDSDTSSSTAIELPRPEILPPPVDRTAPIAIAPDDVEAGDGQIEIKRRDPLLQLQRQEREKSQLVVNRESAGASWRLSDLFPLLAVLGLIGLCAVLLKRFMPARSVFTGDGALRVVARLALSPKQSLVLVKMGRQLVLLGATGEQVNALTVVSDPNEVAYLLGDTAGARSDSMSRVFEESFTNEMQAYEAEDSQESEVDTPAPIRDLLEKVRRMGGARDVA